MRVQTKCWEGGRAKIIAGDYIGAIVVCTKLIDPVAGVWDVVCIEPLMHEGKPTMEGQIADVSLYPLPDATDELVASELDIIRKLKRAEVVRQLHAAAGATPADIEAYKAAIWKTLEKGQGDGQ